MGISIDFADNVSYGASDLNSLRCALATKGVLPEESSSCKAILGSEAGTVKICGGQALFSDGSRCLIDSDGVIVTVTNTSYLYLSQQEDSAEVRSSGALPSGGSTVLIAKATVSSSGIALEDMREYTTLKIPSCTVNTYDEFILKKNFTDAAVKEYNPTASLKSDTWCKVHEFDVKNYRYKYVMLFDNAENSSDKKYLGWGKISTSGNENGVYWTACNNGDQGALEYGINEIMLYQYASYIKRIRFVRNGSKVEVYYFSNMASNLPFYFNAQVKFA